MILQKLRIKIEELENWLKSNPNHPNRITIEADLRHFRAQFEQQHGILKENKSSKTSKR